MCPGAIALSSIDLACHFLRKTIVNFDIWLRGCNFKCLLRSDRSSRCRERRAGFRWTLCIPSNPYIQILQTLYRTVQNEIPHGPNLPPEPSTNNPAGYWFKLQMVLLCKTPTTQFCFSHWNRIKMLLAQQIFPPSLRENSTGRAPGWLSH